MKKAPESTSHLQCTIKTLTQDVVDVNLILIMCPKCISIPISLLQAYFTKMSPFGRSKISVSTLKEDNNALTHRYEAKASGVFTEQHSLNQPGYKVLFSLYSEKKEVPEKFATVAAPCCSVGTAGKARLPQNNRKLNNERA